MTIEEVYVRLKGLAKQSERQKDESFDKIAAFKFLHNNILDLLDEMSYLDEQDELLDDDWFESKDFHEEHNQEQHQVNNVIDIDDLI